MEISVERFKNLYKIVTDEPYLFLLGGTTLLNDRKFSSENVQNNLKESVATVSLKTPDNLGQGILYVDGWCASIALLSKTLL